MTWPHWLAHEWNEWSEMREAELTVFGKDCTAQVQIRTCVVCKKIDLRTI